MTKTVTALCDNCDYITEVTYKQKKHKNDIQETYFTCEHCYHNYTCFVTDTWVRKKHKKAAELRSRPRKTGKTQKLLELQEEINRRMSVLKHNLINYGRADL